MKSDQLLETILGLCLAFVVLYIFGGKFAPSWDYAILWVVIVGCRADLSSNEELMDSSQEKIEQKPSRINSLKFVFGTMVFVVLLYVLGYYATPRGNFLLIVYALCAIGIINSKHRRINKILMEKLQKNGAENP